MIKNLLFGLSLAGLMISGCAVSKAMQSEPGTDISTVRPGSERRAVEALLGAPLREWTTNAAIHYCVYAYDGGRPASVSDASAIFFLDVISLGLSELFISLDDDFAARPRKEIRLAVAYTPDEEVLGVFDDVGDFDILPADGVKTAGKSSGGGNAQMR